MKRILFAFGIVFLAMLKTAHAQCPPTSPIIPPIQIHFNNEALTTGSGPVTLQNCWIAGRTTNSSSTNWRVNQGATSTADTGPNADASGGPSGKYLYFEASGSGNVISDSAFFISPEISLTNLANPQISFLYHKYGSDMGDLSVDIYDGLVWHRNIIFIPGETHGSSSAPYSYTYSPLYSFAQDTIQVRFRATRGIDNRGDMAIDEVKIESGSTCPFPINVSVNNITDSSAIIMWDPIASSLSYKILIGPKGFNPTTATVLTTVADSIVVNNLMPHTEYEYYLFTECSGSIFSDTTGPKSFITKCLGPYSGTYTVGQASSDFVSMTLALNLLKICGVNGPVVLQLNGTTISESWTISNIPGSSQTNTITIDGSGLTKLTIPNSTIVGIHLDNCEYINIENLNVDGSFCEKVIDIVNSQHITVNNCTILAQVPTGGSNTFRGINIGIPYQAPYYIADITVSNCLIKKGDVGFSFVGQTTNYGHKISLSNNQFEQCETGISIQWADSTEVLNNITLATSQGLFFSRNSNFNVEGNTFYGSLWFNGAYESNIIPASNSTAVNNIFTKGTFSFASLRNTLLAHNSFYAYNFSQIAFLDLEACSIVNNIFQANNNEAFTNNATFSSNVIIDYNIYHRLNPGPIASWQNTTYTTLSAWKTAVTSLNDSSLQGSPQYASPTNLRIITGTLANDKGDNSLNVNYDIDGKPRPLIPGGRVDIGAYEYIPGQCLSPTSISLSRNCNVATLSWSSYSANTNTYIEYGSSGFSLGNGTVITSATSPTTISGLSNVLYDFYLIDSCASGISYPILIAGTAIQPYSSAAFTWSQSSTTSISATIDFDASLSTNANSYMWDFGDGSSAGTGKFVSHQYQSNGSYTITLTVFGPCDTIQTQDSIVIQGIDINENALRNQILLYPNPTSDFIHFKIQSPIESAFSLNIIDPIGKTVFSDLFRVHTGPNSRDIDLSPLKPGMYFLRIDSPELTTTIKILRL